MTIAGVGQKTAGKLVGGAHGICLYSNAIRGNVDVQNAVSVRRVDTPREQTEDDHVREFGIKNHEQPFFFSGRVAVVTESKYRQRQGRRNSPGLAIPSLYGDSVILNRYCSELLLELGIRVTVAVS